MVSNSLGSFAEALLQPGAPVPDGIINPDGVPATKRFDVYRNNVIVSLVDALASRYPVIKTLVGDEFFQAAAREFVIHHPPQSPVMLAYGTAFPGFLDTFPPAASVPYLGDVARLESARRSAYHAADDPVLDPTRLEQVPPNLLERLTFSTHASLALIASDYAILSIWQANSQGIGLDVPVDTPQIIMICRPAMEVEVRGLPEGAFDFLTALQSGEMLGAAAQAGLLSSPAFDLAATLSGALSAGVFTDFKLAQSIRG
uniref:HvfC/BufC N-terminal domain-containing protein n=1 Tax=Pararhizobium sp. IMCC3301 TaxID=3067904 RepID=UPI002740F895|nr:DNA-binding domain-containing protein [Pararhizobium sp. IMCC3301]